MEGEKREAEHERGLERDEGRQEERGEIVSGEDDPRSRVRDEHVGAIVVDGDHAAVLADDLNAAETEEAVVAPGLEEEDVDAVGVDAGIGLAEEEIGGVAAGVEEKAPERLEEDLRVHVPLGSIFRCGGKKRVICVDIGIGVRVGIGIGIGIGGGVGVGIGARVVGKQERQVG